MQREPNMSVILIKKLALVSNSRVDWIYKYILNELHKINKQ